MSILRRVAVITTVLALGLGTTLGLPAAESGESFSSRLTAEEFAAAGLGELTEAQRAALDHLVAQRIALATMARAAEAASQMAQRQNEPAETASVPENARIRKLSAQPEQRRIRSTLAGAFTGWTGNTVFVLENGQRWMQVEGGTYRAHPPSESPAVQVIPAMMGTYFLKVDGYGTRCRVKLLDD